MKFTNEEKAIKELHCYMYCLQQHINEFEKENYKEAAIYLENAARSLKVLGRLNQSENERNHIINIFVTGWDYDDNY